ncbi:MAG: hypothetical protein U0U67_17645 [Chitinophagales bacterium]
MKKVLHFSLFIGASLFFSGLHAQDNQEKKITEGYYQTIDLNPDTDCKCSQKTERTFQLNKGLAPYDVLNYKLHAYKFTFGTSTNAVAKLFKAFENDASIYKISTKEWTSFMLLTSSEFDVVSFEKAAKQVFATFEVITPKDFLKVKNTSSYNELIQQEKEEQQMKDEAAKQQKITQ